jgi:two-component system, OmpR family, phosphate regulon response regulator PhoB
VSRTILVVEDDNAIREMLASKLVLAGYRTCEAPDAESARRAIERTPPDLILLDWMLPGTSGLELARRLRRNPATQSIPIVMLTARGEEHDRLQGFDAGVDDYVGKPFSSRELIARIRAVLRRGNPQSGDDPVEIDGLRLDPASHRVSAGGQSLKIGPTEFRLLHFFMTHCDRVYTRGQLLDNVWGATVYIEERTVDVHIRRLRKALSDTGHDRLIQTVHGTGYRFSQQSD